MTHSQVNNFLQYLTKYKRHLQFTALICISVIFMMFLTDTTYTKVRRKTTRFIKDSFKNKEVSQTISPTPISKDPVLVPLEDRQMKNYIYSLKVGEAPQLITTAYRTFSPYSRVFTIESDYDPRDLRPLVKRVGNEVYFFDSNNNVNKMDIITKEFTQIETLPLQDESSLILDLYLNDKGQIFYLSPNTLFPYGSEFYTLSTMDASDELNGPKLDTLAIFEAGTYQIFKFLTDIPQTSELILQSGGGDGACGWKAIWKISDDGYERNKLIDGLQCPETTGPFPGSVINGKLYIVHLDPTVREGFHEDGVSKIEERDLLNGRVRILTLPKGANTVSFSDGEVKVNFNDYENNNNVYDTVNLDSMTLSGNRRPIKYNPFGASGVYIGNTDGYAFSLQGDIIMMVDDETRVVVNFSGEYIQSIKDGIQIISAVDGKEILFASQTEL